MPVFFRTKSPPRNRGAFPYLESVSTYGAGALPRSPQVNVVGYVGAAVGFVSQYIRVSNTSAPCVAIAASRLAPFTERSVVEYCRRRGMFDLLASSPGEIV